MNGWTTCDVMEVFLLLFVFNITPVISGRRVEDNIKPCAMEPLFALYMYFMYQVEGR